MTRGGWYESVATRVQYCQPLVATEPPKARPFLEFQKCKSLGGTFTLSILAFWATFEIRPTGTRLEAAGTSAGLGISIAHTSRAHRSPQNGSLTEARLPPVTSSPPAKGPGRCVAIRVRGRTERRIVI